MAPSLYPRSQLRMPGVCNLQLLMSSRLLDGLVTHINTRPCGSVGQRKHHPVNGLSLSQVSSSQCHVVLLVVLLKKFPLSDQGPDLQQYQCWQGIKYFWAAGGPLDLGHFPDGISASPEGQQALKLKQKHIDRFRTSINGCLDTPPMARQTM